MRNTPLKAFAKSPLKEESTIEKLTKRAKKIFNLSPNEPLKPVVTATKKSLKEGAKGQKVGFRKL
tara:strand:+ start:12 stop:206 length:195 start_codon:yes stop_codon:yes gene_type:complete